MPTSEQLEALLQRWTDAGILNSESAARIRSFESAREPSSTRWPVVFAVAFGAIMVAAGVLLFVAAHWDDLSPTQRFLLVLAMVAGFHLAAGALITRMRPLGLALHAVGTISLGAGIFLAGQIFNLQEHWPGGILLWAIGAVLAWLVLQDWLQATLSALLVPAWLASEWSVRAQYETRSERVLIVFLATLAIAYLSARQGPQDSHFRKALGWIGGITLLPAGIALAFSGGEWEWNRHPMPLSVHAIGLLLALGLPLAAAALLRRKSAVWNLGWAAWAYLVSSLDYREVFQNISLHGLCALACIALVLWGLQENRRERINLGVAGFAITITVFYFSNVMGKMGRSASLIAFGLLFLLGGWELEKLRRKLVARTRTASAAGGAS
jgi:uncharacterized membrane protein